MVEELKERDNVGCLVYINHLGRAFDLSLGVGIHTVLGGNSIRHMELDGNALHRNKWLRKEHNSVIYVIVHCETLQSSRTSRSILSVASCRELITSCRKHVLSSSCTQFD